MKLSKDKFTENMNLYLNDLEDYGTEEDTELAESILRPFLTTLEEGEQDLYSLLKETAKKSPAHKQSIKEFIEYVNNI